MLSKFFKEFDEMSSALFSDSSFSMLLGRQIVFPKEDDPKFVYSKESVDKDSVTTIKETWESSDGTTRFSRIVTTPKKKEVTKEDLKVQIKAAVDAEDYELAAKLKKTLEKKKGE